MMPSLGGRTYNKTSLLRNSPEGPKALLGAVFGGGAFGKSGLLWTTCKPQGAGR
jgi:hypothetical protein